MNNVPVSRRPRLALQPLNLPLPSLRGQLNPSRAGAARDKPRHRLHRPLAIAVALGLALGGVALAPNAGAAVTVDRWVGGNSSDWGDPGNWDNPPQPGDDVVIGTTTPNSTHLGSGSHTIGTLQVGRDGNGTLLIDGDASLQLTSTIVASDAYNTGLIIGGVGSEANVTVSGPGASLTVDLGANIGTGGGAASLTVANGATVNIGLNEQYASTTVGGRYYTKNPNSGTGVIIIDGAGSTLNYASGIDFLDGSLSITNGGHMVGHVDVLASGWSDTLGLAELATDYYGPARSGTGTVTISGAGSSWTGVGALLIGGGDVGTFSVLDGGSASFQGKAELGYKRTTGDRIDGKFVIVGYSYGTGSLTVSGQGSTFTVRAPTPGQNFFGIGDLIVAEGGDSVMTVDDHGAVSAAGRLLVGYGAKGTLDIASGGTVTITGVDDGSGAVFGVAPGNHGAVFGYHAGSEGIVTVTGAGSMLVIDAGLQIGHAGLGSLSILEGGTVNAGLTIGGTETHLGFGNGGHGDEDVSGGIGTLLVDGAGSTFHYAGGLNVLNGSLMVSDGGLVVSDSRVGWADTIGFASLANADTGMQALDGQATVVVTGAGSAWNSINALTIGVGGPGSLAVLDGGNAQFYNAAYVGLSTDYYGITPAKAGSGTITVSGAGSTFSVLDQGLNNWIGDLIIAHGGGGAMTVDDYGAVSAEGRLLVGYGADGTLDIASGGTVTITGADDGSGRVHGVAPGNHGAVFGYHAGSEGNVIVTGAGSKLVVDAGLQIGHAGSGSLSILEGGTVNAGLTIGGTETHLGFGNGGHGDENVSSGVGTLLVDGAGSTFHYAGGLNVLNGSMVVRNGGRVVSDSRVGWADSIGFGSLASADTGLQALDGHAAVVVAGAGSAWNSVNALTLGIGGTGSLSVLEGGKAQFLNSVNVGSSTAAYGIDPAKMGAGTVTVAGAGSALTVGGSGIIDVGTDGTGALVVNNGGTVSATGGIKIGANGQVTVGGLTDDGSLAGPGTLNTPTLTLNDAQASLLFQHNALDYVFAPALAGTGHVDVATGFTRLTADSSLFYGTTTVDSGATLSVNGSLGGDLLVAVGGRLEGTGTVENATIAGTLAPGNSPGTLHIDGDLLMQEGSIYEAQIDPTTGASDSVQVAGDVVIESGVTLDVQNLSDQALTPGVTIQLIQSTDNGTVQGQFENTQGTLTDFAGYEVSYDNGTINVGVTRSDISFASAGDSPQGQLLGAALDGVPVDSALGILLFTQLTTLDQATAAFSQLAAPMQADLRRVLLDDSRQPRDAITRHLQLGDSGSSFWVQALGEWGEASAHGTVPSSDTDSTGLLVGADTAVGDGTRLGLAAGFGQTRYAMSGLASSANIHSRHLALYGRSRAGAFGIDYGVAMSWQRVDSRRDFAIGTVAQHLTGDNDGHTGQAFVDVGYRIGDVARQYAEPFVSVAYVGQHNSTHQETGGAAALITQADSTDATLATVGLRWAVTRSSVEWFGSVGWRHAFGLGTPVAHQAFAAGGATFDVNGLPMGDDAAVIDLGARFKLSERAYLSAAYNGVLASDSHVHGAKLTLNVDF